jgi:Transcriptional regulators
MRVSLKDIAHELGVSIAAVSLVLNGKEKEGRVGKEMAEKIRNKAREMHYEPNNIARGLRIGRTQTIGLIIADISNLFFANLAFHIQEHAEKFGYSVIITNTNESDLKMEKMTNILKGRQVDGFIIVPTENGAPYVKDLIKRGIPVVLIDRYFPGEGVSSVVVDNYTSSRNALTCLIDQGCKNIGLVIYKSTLQHMIERKRGYIDVLTEAGLYNPSFIKEINYSLITNDIFIAIESLLMKENNIDGIFFATNTLSMLGIKQLMNLNVKIPEDVKVVCFDKSEVFDFINIPLLYIQQPIPEMGKNAVELVIEQIKRKNNKEEKNVKNIELSATLIRI